MDFEIGEWVLCGKLFSQPAFITNITRDPSTTIVVMFPDGTVRDYKFYKGDVKQFPESEWAEEDIRSMQLLAIDTNDKEWFEELNQKMKVK